METFTIKTSKGRECTIGIRKEYEYDELLAKHLEPLGYKWTIIHRQYGYKAQWNEKVEWMTQLDERTPENVLDYLYDKYGAGVAWGFVEEVAVRV
jgi:predicted house-cleaning noncanonical NTP pyrophosphatase (MazG superfamily)